MHGVPFESLAIGLILVLNAGPGAYQEGKAEEALTRLKAMALPHVWVMREGTLCQAAAKDLVPGDVVRLEAGDRIPADGRLIDGQGVLASEAVLTGLPEGCAGGSHRAQSSFRNRKARLGGEGAELCPTGLSRARPGVARRRGRR